MTEYTGLDIEMEIQTHYHEAMGMIDETLKSIFKGVYERYRLELEAVKRHFPHEDLVWLQKTPVIRFADGIKMLRDSGWKEDDGRDPSEHHDLATRTEKRLGELVKERLHTDYYILDKFPISARPFYTMPDAKDGKVTNSFDFFIRGQEILSGGQRIHDANLLEKRLEEQKIDADQMQEYMEGFRWVAPPHAGAGIGLERLVSLLLQLENVRFASLFPRDPKTFPVQPGNELRHPEDTTLHRTKKGLQPLENLIANYGDATNTSWMDDRYKIWRDIGTGAAVAYVPIHGHVILPGNPLCDASQYPKIMEAFLKWMRKELHLKPIWVLIDKDAEDVLSSKYGWKSLSCTAEQRVDLSSAWRASETNTKQKVSRAKREGVKVIDFGNEVPEDVQQKCNERIKDWQSNRQGEQVHLSDITPWKDMNHRRYFVAQDAGGTVCALVVLAQLAPRNGVQIKWAFEFPNSPSGTIEHATLTAMEAARDAGSRRLTFGIGASARLSSGENMGAMRSTILDNMYQTISARLKLTQKSDFRAKFNTHDDPVYICYPPRGLGVGGPKAILDFFKD
jgi:ergosteryl-3beta-O-L-aspartate synthase